jgi:hypothetical protein
VRLLTLYCIEGLVLTVISPAEQRQDFGASWTSLVLPYLAVVVSSLAIVVNSPRYYPPVAVLVNTIGMVCAAIACFHLLLAFFYRKPVLRDLIVFQFVASFGAYAWLKFAVYDVVPPMFFLPLWFTITGVIVVGTMQQKDPKRIKSIVLGCATFCSILCAIQIATMAPLIVSDTMTVAELTPDVPQAEVASLDTESRPDIYYIVLDAYGRQDVLLDLYGHDNGPFVEQLRQRGFGVGDDSRSNYFFTELSLAATLNMKYLHDLSLEKYSTAQATKQLIKRGRVIQLLDKIGYETVALPTGKDTTECTEFDRYLKTDWAMSDYQTGLFYITPIPDLLFPVDKWIWTPTDGFRDRVSSTLSTLENVPTNGDQPKFVFSHILSPHPPFVFDAEGNSRNIYGRNLLDDGHRFTMLYDEGTSIYIDAYRQQVTHLNQRLLQLVDSIQENSNGEAVIILQADHGPRLWATSSDIPNDLSETFGILNAVYVPKKYGKYQPPVSSVNTFRALFNHCFGTNYELKDDRSYAEGERFDFADVTKRARGGKKVTNVSDER